MLIDFQHLENKADLTCNVCIVGAGAAGITLAKKLSAHKIDSLLLESGGTELETETQSLCEGENAGLDYFPLNATRLRFFGGTTNHWGGQSNPLSRHDFETRAWVPNSGWPLDYGVYEKFLPEAQSICGLNGQDGASWDRTHTPPGTSQFVLGRRFQPELFRYSPKRFRDAYLDEISNAEHIRCLLHANVTRIDLKDSSVGSVTIAALSGKQATIRPRVLVLAAGAIENVRLLLLSPGRTGAGLGNENDVVGRYFMEHPSFNSGEIVLSNRSRDSFLAKPRTKVSDARLRLDLRLSDSMQEELQILNHSAFLVAKEDKEKQPNRGSRVWKQLLGILDDKPADSQIYQIKTRLEHAPVRESRVSLSKSVDALGQRGPKLDLRLSELEERTVAILNKQFAIELGRLGLGRMRFTFPSEKQSWKKQLIWQYHQMGGTRMHASPRHGVVNDNCRVHSVSNLFIAGASVFPTSGHSNPTMNLVALSLRLAEHLKRV